MNVLLSQLTSRLETAVAEKLGLNAVALEAIPSSRDNYVFLNESGDLVVRIGLTKSYADTAAEVKLLKYLRNNDFPVSEVVEFGSITVSDKKYPFVVFRHVEHLQNIRIGKQQVGLAARTLGDLHGLTLPYCRANGFEQHRTLDQALVQLRRQLVNESRTTANKDRLLADLEWGIDFYKSCDHGAPKFVIHNDYRSNNVLFANPSKVACVIDFDWAVKSPFAIKDLGHSALEWSYPNDSKLDRELYEHFVDQYWSGGTPLSKAPLAEVWSWSRFSALTDAAHYFLSFPERTKDTFQSYMYDKYHYFKDNEV